MARLPTSSMLLISYNNSTHGNSIYGVAFVVLIVLFILPKGYEATCPYTFTVAGHLR